MPELVWDQVGDRVYETGLDKGVLYLPDGSAVPWNGLTSIIEEFDRESSPVYFDGMKVSDLVELGSFTATMKAVTYPNEFEAMEGLVARRRGVYFTEQPPGVFALCYRNQIGNDLEGPSAGYKIHILYNVTAIPANKTYATLTADPSLVEFEWKITAVPEEVPNFRPTAHIIIDSTEVDPLLLGELEKMLYGSQQTDASLIPMSELITLLDSFLRFEVVDHGDGRWSVTSDYDELMDLNLSTKLFEISGINASYLDDETYIVSDTKGINDVPQIRIYSAGNGLWTATSDYDALIVETAPGQVDILNANTVVLDADTYQISDTPED